MGRGCSQGEDHYCWDILKLKLEALKRFSISVSIQPTRLFRKDASATDEVLTVILNQQNKLGNYLTPM